MPYHGFASKVYTLAIGPERQKFNVQEHIITQIPHFRRALTNGDLEQEIHYIMEKDDPEAVAMVLAFVRDGVLPVLVTEDQKPHTIPSINNQIEDYVKAYIVALEWGLEAAQNAIIDKTCTLLQRQQKRNKLKIHIDASVQPESFFYSKMYRLLCGQIAHQMQKKLQQLPYDSLRSEAYVLNEAMCSLNWNWDVLFSLTTHLLRPCQLDLAEDVLHNPCSYHVHVGTEECAKDEHGQLIMTKSLAEEAIGYTGANKTKRDEEEGKAKRLTWREMLGRPSQAQTGSTKPYTVFDDSPSQTLKSYEAKQQNQGRQEGSVFGIFGGLKLDCNSVKSNRTSGNMPTIMGVPRETCDDSHREGSEVTSASTGMLTPPSSTTSAASQSTVHAMTTSKACRSRALGYFNPRPCPCGACEDSW